MCARLPAFCFISSVFDHNRCLFQDRTIPTRPLRVGDGAVKGDPSRPVQEASSVIPVSSRYSFSDNCNDVACMFSSR